MLTPPTSSHRPSRLAGQHAGVTNLTWPRSLQSKTSELDCNKAPFDEYLTAVVIQLAKRILRSDGEDEDKSSPLVGKTPWRLIEGNVQVS